MWFSNTNKKCIPSPIWPVDITIYIIFCGESMKLFFSDNNIFYSETYFVTEML